MHLKEQALFFHQFATLLDSGIVIDRALDLASQGLSPTSQKSLQRISNKVASGTDLATALMAKPQVFDPWTTGLIQLAEYSGAVPQLCYRLAIATEQSQQRRRLYRVSGLAASVTIWSLLMLIVALFNGATALIQPLFWAIGFLMLFLLILGTRLLFADKIFSVPPFIQRFPIASRIVTAQTVLEVTNLALPLSCGIPILVALDLLRQNVRDPQLAIVIRKAMQQIRAGQSLSSAFRVHLPGDAVQLLRTGEQSGDLTLMLEKLAQYYAGEELRLLKQIRSMLFSASIMAVGGLIALLGIWGILFITSLGE